MRVLYKGLTGNDVLAWEHFLVGINPSSGVVVDGVFDDTVFEETKKFQSNSGLSPVDGVVGPKTMGKAMELGFSLLSDDRSDDTSQNWPPKPSFGQMSSSDRDKIFGKFAYVSSPTPGNPEAITITDGWAKNNIIMVDVPQFKKMGVTKIPFHKVGAAQLQKMLVEWEAAGLLDKLITFGGSWAPRYIRGSRTYLSNHAWGTAFDVNVQWNMLGTVPALKGQKGSVRELVEIANNNGFYWGGHFFDNETGKGRADGMHFEIAKVI